MVALILSVFLALWAPALVNTPQQAPSSTTITDATVRLPSGATFRLPDSVRSGPQVRQLSVYLTAAERERVKQPTRTSGWDGIYSAIVNVAVPFESCVAHIGTEPFGQGGGTFSDLQFRVYVVGGRAEPAIDRAVNEGRRQAEGPEGLRDVTPTRLDPFAGWTAARLGFTLRGADYGAYGRIDFYAKEFSGRTVVFAFMYSVSQRWPWEPSIAQIVQSFAWPSV